MPAAPKLAYKGLTHKAAATPARAVKVSPEGIVTAIVGVTGVVDEVEDLIVPGVFTVALKARNPKVVDDHEWRNKVGRTLHVEEWMPGDPRLPKKTKDGRPWPKEAGALVATLQYNLRSARGAEAFEWVRFYAEVNEAEFSIGYKTTNARKRRDGVRVILALELYEFSHVLFGAAPLSMALDVKSLNGASGGQVTIPALTESDETEEYDDVEVSMPRKPWDEEEDLDVVTHAPVEAKTAAATLRLSRLFETKEGRGGNAETLRRYWAHGEGAAKIGWGTPGDFNRCVTLVTEHMGIEDARGYCNLRHHDALGFWPAEHAAMEGKSMPEVEVVSGHEVKARGRMKGSYEERIATLEDATRDLMAVIYDAEVGDMSVCPVATFANEAVFTVWFAGEQENYLVPYSADEQGRVELGEPEKVELSLVAEPGGGAEPEEVEFDAEAFGRLVMEKFDAAQALNGPVEVKAADPKVREGQVEADESTISVDNMPDDDGWAEYRKTEPVKARRMNGPFTVQTREGIVECEDGWLAVDNGGYPYPIADDEFENIYEPVDAPAADDADPDAEPAPEDQVERPADDLAAMADGATPPTDEPVDAPPADDEAVDDGLEEKSVKLDPDEHFRLMDELHAALDGGKEAGDAA